MAVYQQILMAIDISQDSEAVGARAVQLVREYGARLTLLHVVANIHEDPVYDLMSSFPADMESRLVENAERSLRNLAEKLDAADAECRVEVGTPKAAIVQTAAETGADLIVLGSHGVHGLELLLGSTANAVLHAADCDVLAVRVGA